MTTNQGHLLRNIVIFGRLLREVGVEVTPTQIVAVVEALKYVNLTSRQDVRNAARTVLISHSQHYALFDQAFELFWQARKTNQLQQMNVGRPIAIPRKKPPQQIVVLLAEEAHGEAEESKEPLVDRVYTYSEQEVLRHKDFAKLLPEELVEVNRLMQAMTWRLEQRRTRRRMRAKQGQYLDMRRTMRHNLRYGGEMLELSWQGRKLKRRPLVIIADMSGSMERYARVLLKFIYVISNGLEQVESFVFSTRLTRLTLHLRHRDIDTALDEAMSVVQDWGGGTRIGESLKTFNYDWARRVLGQGAVVLVISDGWDRGEVTLLDKEMKRLHLSCHRLIWLNPLLGYANYEPLTRGIQAALPHIDHFLPVHNLVSLEQLGKLLETL